MGVGILAFHPSRPIFMQYRDVEVVVDDDTTIRETISKSRWSRRPVPIIVLVHGSGALPNMPLNLTKSPVRCRASRKRLAGAFAG